MEFGKICRSDILIGFVSELRAKESGPALGCRPRIVDAKSEVQVLRFRPEVHVKPVLCQN